MEMEMERKNRTTHSRIVPKSTWSLFTALRVLGDAWNAC